MSYGIRGMNAFAGCLKQEKFLCSKEGMEKLFSALEAERPENMQEVVEIAMRLEPYTFPPKISWARKAVMEHCPKVGFSLVQSFRIRGAQVSAHQSFDSASYSCRGLWIPGYSSVIAGASACSQPQN